MIRERETTPLPGLPILLALLVAEGLAVSPLEALLATGA